MVEVCRRRPGCGGQAVRQQAAEMFAQGQTTAQIAAGLRVSEKSVRQWRRKWTIGGVAALALFWCGQPEHHVSVAMRALIAAGTG